MESENDLQSRVRTMNLDGHPSPRPSPRWRGAREEAVSPQGLGLRRSPRPATQERGEGQGEGGGSWEGSSPSFKVLRARRGTVTVRTSHPA